MGLGFLGWMIAGLPLPPLVRGARGEDFGERSSLTRWVGLPRPPSLPWEESPSEVARGTRGPSPIDFIFTRWEGAEEELPLFESPLHPFVNLDPLRGVGGVPEAPPTDCDLCRMLAGRVEECVTFPSPLLRSDTSSPRPFPPLAGTGDLVGEVKFNDSRLLSVTVEFDLTGLRPPLATPLTNALLALKVTTSPDWLSSDPPPVIMTMDETSQT